MHCKAIGSTLDDLKGIHLSLRMYRILMKEDHKPSAQHQRRSKPNMQDVVKKEILKLIKVFARR